MARKKIIRNSSETRKTYKQARDRFGRFLPKQRRDSKGRFMKRRELPPPKWYTPDWKSPRERARIMREQRESVEVQKRKGRSQKRDGGRKNETRKGGVIYRVLFSCPISEAWRMEEFVASFVPVKGRIYQICLDNATNYPLYLNGVNRFSGNRAAINNLINGLRQKIESGNLRGGSEGISRMRKRTKTGKKRRTERKSEIRLLFIEVERE